MFLRAACLFVAVALVSSEEPVEDPKRVILSAFLTGVGRPLMVQCVAKGQNSKIQFVRDLKLYSSDLSDEPIFTELRPSEDYEMETEASMAERSVRLTWKSPSDGGCRIYKCVASGECPSGQPVQVYSTLKMAIGC
ncbi:hypothetical protein PoB_006175100 [Plakobranchus ocellatus]|uniref:Uncharacterized protein n=1 Tax=Plakobranchus ocellatus TaxID=259542 RepID=A0AAV4CTL4_9GAST|nr:hypothetical protein PoB_006175100 [Plakobranchus ocellatus]